MAGIAIKITQPETLEPGDIFGPVDWRGQPPIDGRVFWPMGFTSGVWARKLLEDFRNNGISGVESLDVASGHGDFVEIFILEHTGTENWSEPGNSTVLCSCGNILDRVESVEKKVRMSTFRKRKELPERYLGKNDVFSSHIFWPGFLMREEAFDFVFSQERHVMTTKVSVI